MRSGLRIVALAPVLTACFPIDAPAPNLSDRADGPTIVLEATGVPEGATLDVTIGA